MKLRNKKTGELVERVDITIREEGVVFNNDEAYTSLAELNEEWEDYEEQKEWYWYIEDNGVIQRSCHYEDLHPELDRARKEISNYFNTREEAEQAVEKLKAFKRLKDKGFRFIGLGRDRHDTEDIKYEIELPPGLQGLGEIEDLNTCFRGEE